MFKEFKKEYKEAIKKIKEYDKIVVFRHQRPDYDALGTQLGLAYFLRDSFPYKEIRYVGKNHPTFTGPLYPKMEELDDEFFNSKFLAIVVDTANSSRIDDERWKKADFIIKFDHHPATEQYGNINIVYNELSSASELVTDFIRSFGKKYPVSTLPSNYLYSALVGDTGRFLFNSVTPHTLDTASFLLSNGMNAQRDVFIPMYEKTIESLNFQRFVLDNMKIEGNLAYYIMMDKDLKELNVDSENSKEFLSMLSGIKGIDAWFCVTEIVEKNEFRVSIRSKILDISGVANKYHGGGHQNASGATLYDLNELPNLIKDLQEVLK